MSTTVAQMMINEALPAPLRRDRHDFDKKSLHALMNELAEQHPDQYRETLHRLNTLGAQAGWEGGASISLTHLRKSAAKERILAPVKAEIERIKNDPTLTDDEVDQKITSALLGVADTLPKAVLEESKQENSPFYHQVNSGGRGKASDLNSLRGADLLAAGRGGKFVPVPILNSYADGYDPVELFAGSFAQREGMAAVKLCLGAGTSVRMADGSSKPIEAIQPGDTVWSVDEDRRMVPTRVVRVYDNGTRDCYRWSFFLGSGTKKVSDLIATADHKLLGFMKAKSAVLVGEDPWTAKQFPLGVVHTPRRKLLAALPKGSEVTVEHPNEPWALLVGLMLGDGCLTANNALLSCADPVLLEDIAPYLAGLRVNLRKSGVDPKNYTYTLTDPDLDRSRQIVHDSTGDIQSCRRLSKIRHVFDSLGMWGKYAWEKRIPTEVFGWSNAGVAAVLRGYFACDSCVSVSKKAGMLIKVDSTSLGLLMDVRELLGWRFGIWTGIPTETKAGPKRKWAKRSIYHLHLGSMVQCRQFAELIGYVGCKQQQLQDGLSVTQARRHKADYEVTANLRSWVPVGPTQTYDIEVEHPSHLFVLESGLIVSNSTADAGFASKKLSYATHRQVVTHETPAQHRAPVGLPVKADDRENLGSVLSHDAGTFKAGTIITPQVIEHLKDQGVEDLLVASPMTEMTVDGGISRWAAGKRDQGGMSRVGTNIGLAAAQTYGEKLSQGQLGAKHRTSMGRKVLGGIPYITKLLEAPEHFPEAGPLAEEDGHVKSVRKAPQGGHEVTIGDRLHFINQGLEPIVKEGDLVERGDDLSDGVPHPRDLVRLRGHGEARRVFLKHFQDAARETGADGGRRNAESVVAGLLNWARVTTPDGIGDNVVDDIVPANRLYSQYRPREGSEELAPAMAHGHYLEEPVLHYTPGTYVTKKVAKEIQAWKVPTIHVHKDPPHFEPHMERSVLAVYHDPDWQTRLQGFYTTGAFLNSLHRSGTSDANSTSYVPALARGFGFGEDLATKGTYGTSKTELPRGPMG